MSRKLHKFQTEAEYQAYSASTDYTTPCVALIVDTNVIYYDYGSNKPQVDLSDYKGEFQESSVGGDYWGSSSITKIHYIPIGTTSLASVFNSWPVLEEVTCKIPDTVTNMDDTFYWCSNLVSVKNIPTGVTSLHNTFYNCQKLANIPTIPSGVTSMYDTFDNCHSIVTAPDLPISLEDMSYTFYGCQNLVNVPPIPSGVKNMQWAFSFCDKLKELTLLPTTPPTCSSTLFVTAIQKIYVPDESLEDYRTATGWSEFADKFKPLSSKPSE